MIGGFSHQGVDKVYTNRSTPPPPDMPLLTCASKSSSNNRVDISTIRCTNFDILTDMRKDIGVSEGYQGEFTCTMSAAANS
jgi:hypothetical protein